MGKYTGFYGKLPSHGDFISRNLPRTFIDPWDNWLQTAMASSREQLGEQWLDYFLVSPPWRFVLSDGNCGEQCWVGIIIPSVDRVGRYFPLTIVCHITESVKPMALIDECHHWYEQVEALALAALDDSFQLGELEKNLIAIEDPAISRINANDDKNADNERRFQGHIFMDPVNASPLSAFPALSHFFIEQAFANYSLWWSSGSEDIKPSFLVCEGLPKCEGFVSLLDGDWERDTWQNINSLFVVGDTPALIGI